MLALHKSDYAISGKGGGRNNARQAIQTIGKVDGVGGTYHHKNSQRQVDDANIHQQRHGRHSYQAAITSLPVEENGRCQANRHLIPDLVTGQHSLARPLPQPHIIVNTTQQGISGHHAQRHNDALSNLELPDKLHDVDNHGNNHCPTNNQDTTHCRGAHLLHVGLRPFNPNLFTQLKPPHHLYQGTTPDDGQQKGYTTQCQRKCHR